MAASHVEEILTGSSSKDNDGANSHAPSNSCADCLPTTEKMKTILMSSASEKLGMHHYPPPLLIIFAGKSDLASQANVFFVRN